MAKVVVNDHKWKTILANVEKGVALELQVGILASTARRKHPDSKLTIGEIARIQEYGSVAAGVPARPFLSTAFSKNDGRMKAALIRSAKALMMSPTNLHVELEQLGRLMIGVVHKNIYAGIPPALSPVTVEKKGHDLALIDSGVLIGAITAHVAHHAATSDYLNISTEVVAGGL